MTARRKIYSALPSGGRFMPIEQKILIIACVLTCLLCWCSLLNEVFTYVLKTKRYKDQKAVFKTSDNKSDVPEDDITLINRYVRKPLRDKVIFTFTVGLLDNEVNKKFCRLSATSLTELGDLLVGNLGFIYFDGKMCLARIFKTYTETFEGVDSVDGERYTILFAEFFVVKNGENSELIHMLQDGNIEDINVGYSVRKRVCSICGKDKSTGECQHKKGVSYNGKLCYYTLTEPSDAYDWSLIVEQE